MEELRLAAEPAELRDILDSIYHRRVDIALAVIPIPKAVSGNCHVERHTGIQFDLIPSRDVTGL